MTFPSNCGNWTHIPPGLADYDDTFVLLHALGFRIGRPCKRYNGWQHLHAPVGWRTHHRTHTVAVHDARGRERITITPRIDDQLARIHVLTYFGIKVDVYIYEGSTVAHCKLRDPTGVIHYRAFEFARPDDPFTIHVTPFVIRVVSIFKRQYPAVSNPLAYWD